MKRGGRQPTLDEPAIHWCNSRSGRAACSCRTTGALRKNLTLSGGLGQELQTHLDDRWNLAPRFGLTWSPFKSGKTTIRAGGGIFYDWLDSDMYEQTLRVDGDRQLDRVVRNPGYPNPFNGGDDQQVLPTSKYALAPGLMMPKRTIVTGGISQQLTPLLNAQCEHQPQRRHRSVPRPQHQRAARRRQPAQPAAR